MGTINPTQGSRQAIIAHSRLIHPNTLIGTPQDCSGDFAWGITCYHGYVENAADTNPGYFVLVGSSAASGDDDWVELRRFTAKGTDPDFVNFNATEAAGQTDLTVDVITGLAVGDLLYLQDTNGGSPSGSTGALSSPETLSEWRFMRKAVSTTVTIAVAITNGKDSSDDIYNDASQFYAALDTTPLKRLNVWFVHEGATGANCDVLVYGVALTELATA